jgi:Sigma-54 interaction domain
VQLATGKLTALDFGVTADDWNVLRTARPNVLLLGSDSAVTGFLQLLLPLLQTPVVRHTNGAPLPTALSGTMILRDVGRLSADDQRQLFEWLTEPTRAAQVISTSSCPLFPLVERKALAEPLYYSLNAIMIALNEPASTA